MIQVTKRVIVSASAAAAVALTAGIGLPLANASSGVTGSAYTFDGSNLNIRGEANTSSGVVGALADGETREITCWTTGEATGNENGDNTDVWYNIGEGYVTAAYFFQNGSDEVPECGADDGDDGGATDEYADITWEGTTPEVKDWIAEARAIMMDAGTDPSLIRANDLAIVAMHESGGDPSAVNDWDSNAEQGTPSIGLMQTIQPTFDAHAMAGHTDIYNPVDNIIAASNYMISRYGGSATTPGPQSVNNGGAYLPY